MTCMVGGRRAAPNSYKLVCLAVGKLALRGWTTARTERHNYSIIVIDGLPIRAVIHANDPVV
jgi:hypothetical protein